MRRILAHAMAAGLSLATFAAAAQDDKGRPASLRTPPLGEQESSAASPSVPKKATSASKPHGELRNAWRYVSYNGRWWYWMPDKQWALYNGRQWETFRPESIGSSLADQDAEPGRPRSKLSSSLESNARSILDSTRPQTPLGAASNPGGVGRVIIANPSPIVIEPPTRSGDAGSGVGGGSVGGTSITGSTAR